MKLSIDDIKSIATGVSYVSYGEDGKILLHRFTAEEEELYRTHKEGFYSATSFTAGVKLVFETDSKSLYIKGETYGRNVRNYMAIEVYVNGERIGIHTNYADIEMPSPYVTLACPIGIEQCRFGLGEGKKTVTVYLPWSIAFKIEEMSIDDGAEVKPVKREKLMLAYGDSITQGYDALEPHNRYASLIADYLGADEHNKGIGGEIFFPKLAEIADRSLKPDYVTVAYGTNDWCGRRDAELFKVHVREFYEAISEAYPNAKIFALSPAWRKDLNEGEHALGELSKLGEKIAELTAHIPNVTVIDGFDVIPHSPDCFSDFYLHPNDEGYRHQARGFYEKIKKYI